MKNDIAKILISEEQLKKRIREMGAEIVTMPERPPRWSAF